MKHVVDIHTKTYNITCKDIEHTVHTYDRYTDITKHNPLELKVVNVNRI